MEKKRHAREYRESPMPSLCACGNTDTALPVFEIGRHEPVKFLCPGCGCRRTQLDDLVGIHTVDARGQKNIGDAFAGFLRIDDVVYVFQEDPCDGYRSHFGEIRRASADDLEGVTLSTFALRVCSFSMVVGTDEASPSNYRGSCYILIAIDEATNLRIFETGTENLDDYYPSFIFSWTPEGIT